MLQNEYIGIFKITLFRTLEMVLRNTNKMESKTAIICDASRKFILSKLFIIPAKINFLK